MKSLIFGIATMIPVLTGPLPAPENALRVALCNGGSIEIPLGDRDDEAPAPCETKGCHAGNCRKQFDSAQRRKG